jgi:hypothetical protein
VWFKYYITILKWSDRTELIKYNELQYIQCISQEGELGERWGNLGDGWGLSWLEAFLAGLEDDGILLTWFCSCT